MAQCRQKFSKEVSTSQVCIFFVAKCKTSQQLQENSIRDGGWRTL